MGAIAMISAGGKIVATMSKKEVHKSWLVDVPPDKVFWCHDGRVVNNLDELIVALREMLEKTFRYHVTMDKNDFSNWVRDVIGDVTLARELLNAATPTIAAQKVETRLRWLRARL